MKSAAIVLLVILAASSTIEARGGKSKSGSSSETSSSSSSSSISCPTAFSSQNSPDGEFCYRVLIDDDDNGVNIFEAMSMCNNLGAHVCNQLEWVDLTLSLSQLGLEDCDLYWTSDRSDEDDPDYWLAYNTDNSCDGGPGGPEFWSGQDPYDLNGVVCCYSERAEADASASRQSRSGSTRSGSDSSSSSSDSCSGGYTFHSGNDVDGDFCFRAAVRESSGVGNVQALATCRAQGASICSIEQYGQLAAEMIAGTLPGGDGECFWADGYDLAETADNMLYVCMDDGSNVSTGYTDGSLYGVYCCNSA